MGLLNSLAVLLLPRGLRRRCTTNIFLFCVVLIAAGKIAFHQYHRQSGATEQDTAANAESRNRPSELVWPPKTIAEGNPSVVSPRADMSRLGVRSGSVQGNVPPGEYSNAAEARTAGIPMGNAPGHPTGGTTRVVPPGWAPHSQPTNLELELSERFVLLVVVCVR